MMISTDMIAIVVSEDQYLQRTASLLLTRLGYHTVLTTDHIDEASYFFSHYLEQINLILFESPMDESSDLPLARLVIQKSELNFIPLIFTSNHSKTPSFFSFQQHQLSRVDVTLSKPFGINQLKNSIAMAHRRRANLRNRLVVFSDDLVGRIAETIYIKALPMHWKEVIGVKDLNELKEQLSKNSFRIGGVLIDPGCKSPALSAFLRQYKKSFLGGHTPLAILGTDPEEVAQFRLSGDLFFDLKTHSRSELLSLLSKRLIYSWEVRDLLFRVKGLQKEKDFKGAAHLIRRGLKLDPNRWELLRGMAKIHEATGDKKKAIEFFEKALLTNPCDPYSYLSLISMFEGHSGQRAKTLQLANLYCSGHPQIQEKIKETQESDAFL